MPQPIEGPGTPECAWRAWTGPDGWPLLDLATCRRAVVVAPHPDDEVLGVGGVLAVLAGADVPVTVVAVTDGEASHPASRALPRDRLAALRAAETTAALTELAVGRTDVRRLGVPDGGVAAREHDVAAAVAALLQPGDWCLATWAADGHPDHEAVGRAAATACAATGARLLAYPVWTWHWAVPDDPRVPWERALRVPLAPDVRAAKERAVACFRTQVAPLGPAPGDAVVLPAAVLERFDRRYETLFG